MKNAGTSERTNEYPLPIILADKVSEKSAIEGPKMGKAVEDK